MKSKLIYLVLIALMLFSCKLSKNISLPKGEINDAINNAIVDFLHTKKRFMEKDSVFSIYIENVNDDVLGIGISGEKDKIALFTNNEVDYDYRFFPTRIYEHQNKLFYWKDTTISVTKEIITKFYSLNKVDTMIYQKKFPVRTIDEKQKVFHYYYCKNNLYRYHKKKMSIANTNYEIPKINCNPDVSNLH